MNENKLKHLYVELKTHDKEAMALKKLKIDDMDKEGLRESEIRKRFNGIMYSYGLANPSTKRNEGGLSENQVRKFFVPFSALILLF